MRPMPNEPFMNDRDKIYTLVQSGSEVFLDRPNDSPIVIPTWLDRSIQPTIETFDIGIVEYDLAIVGEIRKPCVDFLNGMVVEVTRINKQHIDSWVDMPLSTPISKHLGELDIVRPDEWPPGRFGAGSAAIIEIHADQESSGNLGDSLQSESAFAAAHAKFDDQPWLYGKRFRKDGGEVIRYITWRLRSTILDFLQFRQGGCRPIYRPHLFNYGVIHSRRQSPEQEHRFAIINENARRYTLALDPRGLPPRRRRMRLRSSGAMAQNQPANPKMSRAKTANTNFGK